MKSNSNYREEEEFLSYEVYMTLKKCKKGDIIYDTFGLRVSEMISYARVLKEKYGTNLKRKYLTWCMTQLEERFYEFPEEFNYPYENDYEKSYKYQIDVIKNELKKGKKAATKEKCQKVELIKWRGSQPQLMYLFELLVDKDLVSYDFQYEWNKNLANHFSKKNGRRFTNTELAKSRCQYTGNKSKKPKKADAEVIEKIVEEVKNLSE